MEQNVHKIERVISIAAGSALAVLGFRPKTEYKRFSLPAILTTIAGASLTTVGLLYKQKRTKRIRNIALGALGAGLVLRGITGTSLTYKALGVATKKHKFLYQQGIGIEHRPEARKGIRSERSIIVNLPIDKVYKLFSNFEIFPQFMNNVESVKFIGADRVHFKVKSTTGATLEYDARIKTNIPNEVISWESISGDLPNAAAVRFENVDGGTRVEVTMEVNPPGGLLGKTVALIFKEPNKQLEEDLANFKKFAEGTKANAATATSSTSSTNTTSKTV